MSSAILNAEFDVKIKKQFKPTHGELTLHVTKVLADLPFLGSKFLVPVKALVDFGGS